jgi:hypothetical protein
LGFLVCAGRSVELAMRKWVMRVHMYAGLPFFGFLVLFALSGLCFNHTPAFMEATTATQWQQTVAATPRADPALYAGEIAAELGLRGTIFQPTIGRASGALDFELCRPGRYYKVHVAGAAARIDEQRWGWAATVAQLHGVRPTSNSVLLNMWAWYGVIGSIVLAGAVVMGVALWAILPRERIVAWSLLAGAGAVSGAMCFAVWAWG